jgi:hypothetical protein
MLDGSPLQPEVLENAAMRAARYCGEAAAMAVNLAGNPQRAELWHAEEMAWRDREEKRLAAVFLNRQVVYRKVLEIGQASFANNLVNGASRQPH